MKKNNSALSKRHCDVPGYHPLVLQYGTWPAARGARAGRTGSERRGRWLGADAACCQRAEATRGGRAAGCPQRPPRTAQRSDGGARGAAGKSSTWYMLKTKSTSTQMTVTQVPFFLSSASGRRPNAGGTKFTVECSPALSIPSKATACTLHVHSASVPYTWNNVDSTNNAFVV